jgi:hypothetical protein
MTNPVIYVAPKVYVAQKVYVTPKVYVAPKVYSTKGHEYSILLRMISLEILRDLLGYC